MDVALTFLIFEKSTFDLTLSTFNLALSMFALTLSTFNLNIHNAISRDDVVKTFFLMSRKNAKTFCRTKNNILSTRNNTILMSIPTFDVVKLFCVVVKCNRGCRTIDDKLFAKQNSFCLPLFAATSATSFVVVDSIRVVVEIDCGCRARNYTNLFFFVLQTKIIICATSEGKFGVAVINVDVVKLYCNR
ncbi:hypothetical protein [Lambdina fiscellaria nucleopolyhedrovirus]|uniref:Uncharacterized protein n=1 Tax=Lambdina fiscellaria nucleopolyhedrovirus TaxID=1642929 RepID=A0A0E3URP2_9ABAC|nr:hypothetical protein [Lambdina fiscellaria nucleopolyhedrovirus]AKC91639.1 hypothetical protein [Lambdina fiscellaria nucleopolyhedrovirus]